MLAEHVKAPLLGQGFVRAQAPGVHAGLAGMRRGVPGGDAWPM